MNKMKTEKVKVKNLDTKPDGKNKLRSDEDIKTRRKRGKMNKIYQVENKAK